jgi:hypothetical protein
MQPVQRHKLTTNESMLPPSDAKNMLAINASMASVSMEIDE